MRSLCQELAESGEQLGQPGRGPLAGEDGADGGGRNAVYEHPKKRHCHPLRRDGGRPALVFVALMGGLIALMVWGLTVEPAEAPPLGLMLFLLAIPGVVIIGVLLALWQRIKQIRGGEEDAASKY